MISIKKHGSNNITCLVCWCLMPLSTNMFISYNVAFSLIGLMVEETGEPRESNRYMIDIPHPCQIRLSSVHIHHEQETIKIVNKKMLLS